MISVPKGDTKERWKEELFISVVTGLQVMTSKESGVKLDIKKKSFTMRVVKNRFPREVVGVPSLEEFSARFGGALAT